MCLGINLLGIGLLNVGVFKTPTFQIVYDYMISYYIPPFFVWCIMVGYLLCSLLFLSGFLTRVSAVLILVVLGIQTSYFGLHVDFFMLWKGVPPYSHEGFEFHLMAILMSLSLLISGSGSYSIDRKLSAKHEAEFDLTKA